MKHFFALGYDFISLILSYLGIRDRIRMEKVCKAIRNISINTPLHSLDFRDLKSIWSNGSSKEVLMDVWKEWSVDVRTLRLELGNTEEEIQAILDVISSIPVPPNLSKLRFDPRNGYHSTLHPFLLESGAKIRELWLCNSYYGETAAVKKSMEMCPNLETIKLEGVGCLRNLLAFLPKSTRAISLIDCRFASNSFFSFQPLFNYPKLVKLTIKRSGTPKDVHVLNSLSLRELYWTLENDSLFRFQSDSVLSTSLTSLNLNYGSFHFSLESIANLPRLEELSLRGHISRECSVTPIYRNCPHLRSLLIEDQLLGLELEILCEFCRNLEHLSVPSLRRVKKSFEIMLQAMFAKGRTQKLIVYCADEDLTEFDFPQHVYLIGHSDISKSNQDIW